VFEPGRNISRLFLQADTQHLPVVGILEKCFLAADALDLVSEFPRPGHRQGKTASQNPSTAALAANRQPKPFRLQAWSGLP
jgi:hypothetical protein